MIEFGICVKRKQAAHVYGSTQMSFEKEKQQQTDAPSLVIYFLLACLLATRKYGKERKSIPLYFENRGCFRLHKPERWWKKTTFRAAKKAFVQLLHLLHLPTLATLEHELIDG